MCLWRNSRWFGEFGEQLVNFADRTGEDCLTSAPVPCDSAIGKNPRLATSAVISTGRKRSDANYFSLDLILSMFVRSKLIQIEFTYEIPHDIVVFSG